MSITYHITIDHDDDGVTDTGETLTPDVLDLWWRLGMANAYDSMAVPSQARITVRNPGRTYSPEVAALLPGKVLRIQSDDGTTTRTHFTGFVSHVEPAPGEWGAQTAVIHARGLDHDLSQSVVRITPQQSVTADAVIDTLLDAATVRRPILQGYCIVGVAGYNALDSVKLFGPAVTRSLEKGKSVFAYVGDTWGAGIAAADAIRQLAASERGRFTVNRLGEAVFINRHHTLLNVTSAATFSDDMAGMGYVYGADIVNRVEMTVTPRSVGAPGTLLWSLANVQTLPPGTQREIIARYRDENDNPLGALDISDVDSNANTQSDGSGADRTSSVEVILREAGMSAARLEIRNPTDDTLYLLALELRGTPLISGDPVTLVQSDPTEQTFTGLRRLALDLPALSSLDEAEQMARYELARRRSPRGTVRALTVDARQHPAQALARTLFDRITVTETQTGHSADYHIIAEEHHVDQGGTRHCVTWTLEAADSDRFFILGTHAPDGSRVLAY